MTMDPLRQVNVINAKRIAFPALSVCQLIQFRELFLRMDDSHDEIWGLRTPSSYRLHSVPETWGREGTTSHHCRLEEDAMEPVVRSFVDRGVL